VPFGVGKRLGWYLLYKERSRENIFFELWNCPPSGHKAEWELGLHNEVRNQKLKVIIKGSFMLGFAVWVKQSRWSTIWEFCYKEELWVFERWIITVINANGKMCNKFSTNCVCFKIEVRLPILFHTVLPVLTTFLTIFIAWYVFQNMQKWNTFYKLIIVTLNWCEPSMSYLKIDTSSHIPQFLGFIFCELEFVLGQISLCVPSKIRNLKNCIIYCYRPRNDFENFTQLHDEAFNVEICVIKCYKILETTVLKKFERVSIFIHTEQMNEWRGSSAGLCFDCMKCGKSHLSLTWKGHHILLENVTMIGFRMAGLDTDHKIACFGISSLRTWWWGWLIFNSSARSVLILRM